MQTPTRFREIGHGHCGSVWTDDDGVLAIKREDGSPGRTIAKDAAMHQRIQSALTTNFNISHLNIPTYHHTVSAEDTDFWTARLPCFPHDATHKYEACNAVISERIQPFARSEREMLIELYCHPDLKEKIKRSKPDEDCLIRPYLGRTTHTKNPNRRGPSRFFTLRNRPLNLDQLVDLRLPVGEYARVMAEALATIYWAAGIDANDIEFVLAPAGSHSDTQTWESETLGEHSMWVLDFDCCNSITLDEAGIEQAARAFYRNDAYYPRPTGDNDELWRIFAQRFLERSQEILGESKLPGLMIERLEQLGAERREAVRSLSAD